MKIKDLKSGYVVQTRKGERYIVSRVGQNSFDKYLVNKDHYLNTTIYDEALCSMFGKDDDIVKVYGLSGCPAYAFSITDLSTRPLLWERPKPKKITFEQIEKLLGYPIEIVSEANNE
jgi:hypothetical protein